MDLNNSIIFCEAYQTMNDKHVQHIDGYFCTATIWHLEELASILGPNEVYFISQDDKACVPIGLTAANKQSHC